MDAAVVFIRDGVAIAGPQQGGHQAQHQQTDHCAIKIQPLRNHNRSLPDEW
jgi:hypothetical protein